MDVGDISQCFESMSLNKALAPRYWYQLYASPPVLSCWSFWRGYHGEELFQQAISLLSRTMALWYRLCYPLGSSPQDRTATLSSMGPLCYVSMALAEMEATLNNTPCLAIPVLTPDQMEARIESLEEEFLQLLTMKFDPTLAPVVDNPYQSAAMFSERLYMNRRPEELPRTETGLFLFITYACCRLGYVMPPWTGLGHEARVLDQLYTCSKSAWNKDTLKAMWSY